MGIIPTPPSPRQGESVNSKVYLEGLPGLGLALALYLLTILLCTGAAYVLFHYFGSGC